MSSKIIMVLLWLIAAAAGLGAFVIGTSAFDRYVVSDPPKSTGNMPDALAAAARATKVAILEALIERLWER